jgi:hypothetical protein
MTMTAPKIKTAQFIYLSQRVNGLQQEVRTHRYGTRMIVQWPDAPEESPNAMDQSNSIDGYAVLLQAALNSPTSAFCLNNL